MVPAKRKDEASAAAAPAPAPANMRVTRAAAKRSAAVQASEKKGKGTKKQKKNEEVRENKGEGEPFQNVLDSNKTIVVEHWSFKTNANVVKDGLEKADKGIRVILNPQKPRRGCFEVRQQGGKTFVTLLGMKRPFKPMKDLDMHKVISEIIDEISKD